MKRKIVYLVLIIVMTLLLTGCGNAWDNKIKASKFKVEDDYIVGQLKNITDKSYDLKITFALKNGSINDTDVCYELIKGKETINIKCITSDHDGYKVEIKNIELEEKKVKKLKAGKIGTEEVEYYFTDIYNEHLMNIAGMAPADNITDYPYISEAEYNEEDEILKITGSFATNNGPNTINYIAYTEEFDTSTNQLNELMAFIRTDDEEYLHSVLTKISFMESFNKTKSNAIELLTAMKRDATGFDKCIKVGNEWCVSSSIDDGFYTYFISVLE